MSDPGSDPRCAHQLHYDDGGSLEPSNVCASPIGPVHMHDCPVTLGLECVHRRDHGGEPTRADAAGLDREHTRLMEDFLTPAYRHRVRALQPSGDAWIRRGAELEEEYADVLGDDTPEESPEQVAKRDARYEQEKERLIGQRRERDARRAEQEEKVRAERAAERTRRGIKTVVERAQESVAAQGNVASSWLDEVELPGGGPKPRRRRKGGGAGSGGEGAPEAGGGRRRRGRRKGGRRKSGGQGEAGSPGGTPPSGGGAEPKKRRRRRRRKKGGGGGADSGGAPGA